MSKSKPILLSDFQLSMYANKVHVGLDKLKFDPYSREVIEGAIKDILRQNDIASKSGIGVQAETKIPYSMFPKVRDALRPFDLKTKETDFLVLYFKHTIIGIIKEDVPHTIPTCSQCGLMVKEKVDPAPALPLWKRTIRFFFPGAFAQEKSAPYFVCHKHGPLIHDPVYTTI